jgi:hypothetical protein
MDSRIASLKEIVGKKNLREIDKGIATILDSEDPSLISQLFCLFDDGLKDDQIMFSIIHAVESLENSYYLKSFLQHLDGMMKFALPESAAYLLLRIANHQPSFSMLKEELAKNPTSVKAINEAKERVLKMKPDSRLLEI